MSRILITGAGGFVGGYLFSFLQHEGDDVWGTAHEGPVEGSSAARTLHLDVRDAEAVRRVVRQVRPDEIYHLAGLAHPARHGAEALMETNVLGCLNVLLSARDVGAAVLAVSSGYAYGPVVAPVREDVPLRPIEPYGASKAAMEMVASSEAAAGGSVVVVRPFNHSGPGQPPTYLLPTLVRQVVEIERDLRNPVLELGNLDSARDFTDVRDVVRAYPLLLRGSPMGEVYNVSSGRAITVRELARKVVDAASVPVRIVSRSERRRSTDIPLLVGDPSKARETVGWTATTPLDGTLGDMLADERSRPGRG